MTEQENRKLNELSITLAKACKEGNNEVINATIPEIVQLYFRFLGGVSITPLTRPMAIVAMRNFTKTLDSTATKDDLEFADAIMKNFDIIAVVKPL